MFNKMLAEYGSLYDVANGMNNLLKKILGPVLVVIGVMAVAYAVYLGVMYAKAEDAGKRKEVQGRLIGALIGAVIIIVGVTVCYAVNWVKVFNSFAGEGTVDDNPGLTTIASLVRLMVR